MTDPTTPTTSATEARVDRAYTRQDARHEQLTERTTAALFHALEPIQQVLRSDDAEGWEWGDEVRVIAAQMTKLMGRMER